MCGPWLNSGSLYWQELVDGKVLIRESIATIRSMRDNHRAKQDEWWAGEEVSHSSPLYLYCLHVHLILGWMLANLPCSICDFGTLHRAHNFSYTGHQSSWVARTA